MRVTLEIPDPIFRKARAMAAERGIPLRQFVIEAIEEKLRFEDQSRERPWMRGIGGLRHLHEENLRIARIIEEEFETIDPEEWV